MSLSRRIFDLARANLNALLDKANNGETSIDELSDAELEAELQRRRDRRLREDEERAAARRAADHARARAAASGAADATRGAAAGAAQTRGSSGSSSAGTGANRSQGRERRPLFSSSPSDKRLRELYAQLEVPFGASFDEVKKSFRRLMRKYHPDLHLGNPQKHKTATQLTMSLTQAYNELELHLVGGPNKGPR
jgi:DnaJ-domain-containing protein 1